MAVFPIHPFDAYNEAPRRKRRGIKRNSAEANPPSLYELRRGSPRHSSLWQAAGYSGEGE